MTRSAAQIRAEFVEFFRARGHTIVDGSPVVPHDDPTLLFTNAGMNQFKPLFLGTADRSSEFGRLRRAANSQPCIRAGGKHNDLDDVGHDTYHHTFFEMLGNWSFGDYFKREAITWAWELLTQVWGLDRSRLHATYFQGDPAEGLEPDHEARQLWAQIAGLPPEHIHPGNKKDNFWEMGETGPCGPCSEVHIDLTPDKCGAKLVNTGDARVMEVWNLVFIQYNRGPDGLLTPLPDKHVDTGMGFERICAVVQGKRSNYDTDIFAPLFNAIREVTGAPAYGGLLESPDLAAPAAPRADVMRDVAYRVIADHIRTLTFALADGAIPDKEGRGYVLRRILRRAVRYGWQHLGMREPFLSRLAPAVVALLGDAFPHLRGGPRLVAGRPAPAVELSRVVELIHDEEQSFGRTLERGIALFEDAAVQALREHHGELRGSDAFKLHDTFGFPIDLTQIMASERGLRVDIGEYERLMEDARERARAGGKTHAGAEVPSELLTGLPPTDDSPKHSADLFVAPLCAIVRTEPGQRPELLRSGAIEPGARAALIFEQTCFYAEQGEQVGDRGEISGASLRFDVESTQRVGEIVLHHGTLVQGRLSIGQEYEQRVHADRASIRRNHTATHVLNWALRETLGEHVQQKGSLVDADKTRFDFSHPKPLTLAEIEQIESRCAEQIQRDLRVDAQLRPHAEALRINGLRAVFGEKYPDQVRVVSIGASVAELVRDPTNAAWRGFSIEFCGGTHVRSTGEIGSFTLISEEAIAKGVRRVVGVSGDAARLTAELGQALLSQARQAPNSPESLAARVAELQQALQETSLTLRHRIALRELLAQLQESAKKSQRAANAASAGQVRAHALRLLDSAERVGGVTLLVATLPDTPVDQLKQAADALKQKAGSAALLLASVDTSSERVTLLAAVSDDLIRRGVKAGDWVKAVATLVDGGGGGPPSMAQAGGKNPQKLPEALAAARQWINERLK